MKPTFNQIRKKSKELMQNHYSSTIEFKLETMANWAIEQMDDEWVDVNERLPEVQMRCLVLFEESTQPDLMWFMPEYPNAWKNIKIAYWQPLPQPPKKTKE